MISQRQIKHIVSLHTKKFRSANNSFLVQGKTMVHELLESDWELVNLYCLESEIPEIIDRFGVENSKIVSVDERQLSKISTLSTPNRMLAEVKMKPVQKLEFERELYLLLDGVKDPGNLGTIIRIADQFGVSAVICSNGTVDQYNPKVVQSTMGSLFRVPVHYGDSSEVLESAKRAGTNVIASEMDGSDIYESEIPEGSLIIMGSESHGVSKELLEKADQRLSIPNFGEAESLNVAVAAAVFCSEYRARARR